MEDEVEMRGEEGDSTERQEESEERDFGGVKRARSSAPAFSSEHELEIIEFV